ncbi:MAG TPA: hypothetical protein VI912_05510 [Candidatus Bilamarchaeaceae archaeon]|nr:hypothetical protein [Candidatus Bilamarchaeaceae archaeon]
MQLVYVYDIKAKDKKDFNRVKRRFYYHFNKLDLRDVLRTKSVLIVPLIAEKMMDAFFKQFSKKVEVYKILAESIEQV